MSNDKDKWDSMDWLSEHSGYSGISSFWKAPYTNDLTNVDVAVYGIPYDVSTFNRAGTRFGPRAIRDMSCYAGIFAACWPHTYEFKSRFNLIDCGDVSFIPGKTESMLESADKLIGSLVDKNISTLGLGGDHLVAYPALKAHARKNGKLSLIHFDAHLDTAEMPFLSHGSMFYYAAKEGLIDPETSIQLGIRTTNPATVNMNVITADQCHALGAKEIIKKIRDVVGDRACYISIDVDGMDPAFTPGTGTPVPGGLTSAMQREILWGLVGLNAVGGDVVEVSPPYDVAQTTALVAAVVGFDILYILGEARIKNKQKSG